MANGYLVAIGCYQGDLYDGDAQKAQTDLTTATSAIANITNDLNKWLLAFPKTETDFNKEPSAIKNDYLTYKGNQEVHTDYDKIKADLKKYIDALGTTSPAEIKTELDNKILTLNNTIEDQQVTITKRDNTILEQEKELTKKIDTIQELNQEIQKLKDQQLTAIVEINNDK
nr:5736_t:CDS:2 [Entrophospora candida]